MVTIGVSGHRTLSNFSALTGDIDVVFKKIISLSRSKSIRIVSSLAEGADRLITLQAFKNFSCELVVPLPIRKSDYLNDFKSKVSLDEFNQLMEKATKVIEFPGNHIRPNAYLRAGEYMLDHSDVLIVLWDGGKARGIGGTANIVTMAREKGMPVAWVFASRKENDTKNFPINKNFI